MRAWLRRKAQEYLDKSHDGPDLPDSFVEMAVLWANGRPRATRAEWLALATDLARSAWRDGYLAGFDREQREEKPWQVPGRSPEEVADAADPAWREAVAGQLVDPTMPPTAEPLAEDVLTQDMLERHARQRAQGDDDDDDPG